jgi:hypothetical protein
MLIGAWVILPLLLVLWANGFFKRIPTDQKKRDRFSIRPIRAPKKQSFSLCPWCLSEIELVRRVRRAFECPICKCAFRHNPVKWVVGIPLVAVLCIVIPTATYRAAFLSMVPPVVWMFVGLAVCFAAIRHIPDYRIVERGIEPPPPPTRTDTVLESEAYQASQHISIHKPKQLAAVLAIIAAGTAVAVLLCWLISLGMK